jgi:hypothetical protein
MVKDIISAQIERGRSSSIKTWKKYNHEQASGSKIQKYVREILT